MTEFHYFDYFRTICLWFAIKPFTFCWSEKKSPCARERFFVHRNNLLSQTENWLNFATPSVIYFRFSSWCWWHLSCLFRFPIHFRCLDKWNGTVTDAKIKKGFFSFWFPLFFGSVALTSHKNQNWKRIRFFFRNELIKMNEFIKRHQELWIWPAASVEIGKKNVSKFPFANDGNEYFICN